MTDILISERMRGFFPDAFALTFVFFVRSFEIGLGPRQYPTYEEADLRQGPNPSP